MILDVMELKTRNFCNDVELDIEKYAIMKNDTYQGGKVNVLRESEVQLDSVDADGEIIKRPFSDKYTHVTLKFIINNENEDTDRVDEVDYLNYERLYTQCLTTVFDCIYKVQTVREGVMSFRNAGIYLAAIVDGADDGLPELHLLVAGDVENKKRKETLYQLNRIFKLFMSEKGEVSCLDA